jgi:hypothetical protein
MRDDLHDKVPTCSICKRPVVYGEAMDGEDLLPRAPTPPTAPSTHFVVTKF